MILAVVAALLVGACGDDDSTTDGTPAAGDQQPTNKGATGGGDAGFITIGGETVGFDSARCFLEEQDAAAGGGSILATGQGFGTNAAGEAISFDFTRFSEESQFAGDDLSITVGDPFSDSSYSYFGGLDIGGVAIDGSTLSASGFTLQHSADFSQVPVAFELNC